MYYYILFMIQFEKNQFVVFTQIGNRPIVDLQLSVIERKREAYNIKIVMHCV